MLASPRSLRRFLAMSLLLCASTATAEDVIVGKNVAPSARVPLGQVDHTPWNDLLQKYVNEGGRVNYKGWKASSADSAKLDAYLNALSAGDTSTPSTTAEKIAFWSNAYNAVTVKGILREYPTSSIRNHTAKLWGYNIWKNLKIVVSGKPINLNDIEHEVLRKLGDHRIHFAIVCASIGCPRLLNEAYVADRLDEQLNTNARNFFAQSQNFRVDGNRVYLSAILDWFAGDFGADRQAQLRSVSKYVDDPSTKRVLTSGSARVSYLDYDWNLNEQ